MYVYIYIYVTLMSINLSRCNKSNKTFCHKVHNSSQTPMSVSLFHRRGWCKHH